MASAEAEVAVVVVWGAMAVWAAAPAVVAVATEVSEVLGLVMAGVHGLSSPK